MYFYSSTEHICGQSILRQHLSPFRKASSWIVINIHLSEQVTLKRWTLWWMFTFRRGRCATLKLGEQRKFIKTFYSHFLLSWLNNQGRIHDTTVRSWLPSLTSMLLKLLLPSFCLFNSKVFEKSFMPWMDVYNCEGNILLSDNLVDRQGTIQLHLES